MILRFKFISVLFFFSGCSSSNDSVPTETSVINNPIENSKDDKTDEVDIADIDFSNWKLTLPVDENNNGIFVNLNTIDEKIILELENYIFFIKKQSELIKLDENKKIEIENIYFKNT